MCWVFFSSQNQCVSVELYQDAHQYSYSFFTLILPGSHCARFKVNEYRSCNIVISNSWVCPWARWCMARGTHTHTHTRVRIISNFLLEQKQTPRDICTLVFWLTHRSFGGKNRNLKSVWVGVKEIKVTFGKKKKKTQYGLWPWLRFKIFALLPICQKSSSFREPCQRRLIWSQYADLSKPTGLRPN